MLKWKYEAQSACGCGVTVRRSRSWLVPSRWEFKRWWGGGVSPFRFPPSHHPLRSLRSRFSPWDPNRDDSGRITQSSYFSYNCHSDWPAVTGRGPGCFPAADYLGGEKTARNCLKRVSTPLPVGGTGRGMETTNISNILAFLWLTVKGKNENKQIATTTDKLFY